MDYRLIGVAGTIFAIIMGLFYWVVKNRVSQKFCDERSSRLEDCVESEVKNVANKLDWFIEYTKQEFKEIKELLK